MKLQGLVSNFHVNISLCLSVLMCFSSKNKTWGQLSFTKIGGVSIFCCDLTSQRKPGKVQARGCDSVENKCLYSGFPKPVETK